MSFPAEVDLDRLATDMLHFTVPHLIGYGLYFIGKSTNEGTEGSMHNR
jgi:hypothetical protein